MRGGALLGGGGAFECDKRIREGRCHLDNLSKSYNSV